MDDLISRQEAIRLIWKQNIVDKSVFKRLLMQLPSAQPEIIHCRDCKHKPSGDGVNHNITFPDEVCPCQCDDYWYSWIPDDNWYCGNAERREE